MTGQKNGCARSFGALQGHMGASIPSGSQGMIYRFGHFELNRELFELRYRDCAVRLQRKAFDLLLYLIERRDRVVTKDELLDTLWHDCHVSEAALTQVIKTVRHALNENGAGTDVIVTVRGRGFRFSVPVLVLAPELPAQTPAERVSRPARRAEILRRLADLPSRVLCELEVAAVVGREFGLDDLAGGSPAEPAVRKSFLLHAEREGLIERAPTDGAHFRFCHTRVQRILRASMPAVRKRAIRANLARRRDDAPASTRRPTQQDLTNISRESQEAI